MTSGVEPSQSGGFAVHALLTSHNRNAKTIACLAAFRVASEAAAVSFTITLYDDGSTDGTAEAVRRDFPDACVLSGNGTAYWAGGMKLAETALLGSGRVRPNDIILWLNDDVVLDDDFLVRALPFVSTHPGRVLVAAVRDPDSSGVSYAGFERAGWHPLSFSLVEPSTRVIAVDAFNGNVVLFPAETLTRLGGIDGAYPHALADIDFGMRLRRSGEPALLLPGTYGSCPRNAPAQRSPAWQEWRAFTGRKGGGNREAAKRYVTKFERRKWPLSLIVTYSLWWLRRSRRHWARADAGRLTDR